jgi:hypothetical protein
VGRTTPYEHSIYGFNAEIANNYLKQVSHLDVVFIANSDGQIANLSLSSSPVTGSFGVNLLGSGASAIVDRP